MELNRLQLCNPAAICPPSPLLYQGVTSSEMWCMLAQSSLNTQELWCFSRKKGAVGLCSVPQEGAQKSPKTPSTTGTEQHKLCRRQNTSWLWMKGGLRSGPSIF